jgi:hypothetical protein
VLADGNLRATGCPGDATDDGLVTFERESVPEPALSVGFGFSDDRGFFAAVLVLFVFFVLVLIVVGVSRRHRAVLDGDEPPFEQPTEGVLGGA